MYQGGHFYSNVTQSSSTTPQEMYGQQASSPQNSTAPRSFFPPPPLSIETYNQQQQFAPSSVSYPGTAPQLPTMYSNDGNSPDSYDDVSRKRSVSDPTSARPKTPKSRKKRSCTRWTDEENKKLIEAYVKNEGKNWSAIAKYVGNKTSDQCNQHWHRVLNPAISKKPWAEDEDMVLVRRVKDFGESSWKKISEGLQGRTDLQCRHRWTQLKKILSLKLHTIAKDQPQQDEIGTPTRKNISKSSPRSSPYSSPSNRRRNSSAKKPRFASSPSPDDQSPYEAYQQPPQHGMSSSYMVDFYSAPPEMPQHMYIAHDTSFNMPHGGSVMNKHEEISNGYTVVPQAEQHQYSEVGGHLLSSGMVAHQYPVHYQHVDVPYGMPPEYSVNHSPTTPNVTNLSLDASHDNFALLHHNEDYNSHQQQKVYVEDGAAHMGQQAYFTGLDGLFAKQEEVVLPSISYHMRNGYHEEHAQEPDDEFMGNNQFVYND